LWHRFAFRFSSIPGARGRPLLGPSPPLIVISISTPPLTPPMRFFQGKCCAYPFGKKKGTVEYSFCKMDTPSVPKYLHPLTFTNHIWPFVLFKKFVKM
jgi:hypothetical protein